MGIAAATLIAAAAYRYRWLTLDGALSAAVMGSLIFAIGGMVFAAPLVVFFASSSALTRLSDRYKTPIARSMSKSGPRNARQVLANGGVGCLLAMRAAMSGTGSSLSARDWLLLYLTTLAFANADTWATEIGILSRQEPRLVTTMKRIPAGSSGAITIAGTIAALIGAVLIPISAAVVWPIRSVDLLWRIDAAEILAVGWAGWIACFVDSILGATIQRQYHCTKCERTTDLPMHCGTAAPPIAGRRWISNDGVNGIASITSILIAWFLLRSFAWPIR